MEIAYDVEEAMKDNTTMVLHFENPIQVSIIKVKEEFYLEHTISKTNLVHTCPMGVKEHSRGVEIFLWVNSGQT